MTRFTITPPKDVIARPATIDDVEAAVEFANACSMQLIGKPQLEAHELHNDWGSPNLNVKADLRTQSVDD